MLRRLALLALATLLLVPWAGAQSPSPAPFRAFVTPASLPLAQGANATLTVSVNNSASATARDFTVALSATDGFGHSLSFFAPIRPSAPAGGGGAADVVVRATPTQEVGTYFGRVELTSSDGATATAWFNVTVQDPAQSIQANWGVINPEINPGGVATAYVTLSNPGDADTITLGVRNGTYPAGGHPLSVSFDRPNPDTIGPRSGQSYRYKLSASADQALGSYGVYVYAMTRDGERGGYITINVTNGLHAVRAGLKDERIAFDTRTGGLLRFNITELAGYNETYTLQYKDADGKFGPGPEAWVHERVTAQATTVNEINLQLYDAPPGNHTLRVDFVVDGAPSATVTKLVPLTVVDGYATPPTPRSGLTVVGVAAAGGSRAANGAPLAVDGSLDLEMRVQNNGAAADNVTFGAIGVGSAGDALEFDVPRGVTMAMAPGETYEVTVVAHGTRTAGTYNVTLFANGTTSRTSAVFDLVVDIGVDARASPTSLQIAPGQHASVTFSLEDRGANTTLSFDSVLSEGHGGLSVTPPSPSTISTGERISYTFDVAPPADAPPTQWTIQLRAWTERGVAAALVRVDVVEPTARASFNLSWARDEIAIPPGSNATIPLAVREIGGQPAPVSLSLEPLERDHPWTGFADPSSFSFPAYGSASSNVTIQIFPNATEGSDHVVRARALDRDTGATLGERDIVVHVNPRGQPVSQEPLRISADAETNATTNDTALRFRATVANDGDVDVTTSLGVASDDVHLGAVTSLLVRVPAHGNATLEAGATIPAPLPAGRYAVRLSARGQSATTTLVVRGDAPILLDVPSALEIPANGSATLRVRIASFDSAPRDVRLHPTVEGGFVAIVAQDAALVAAGADAESLVLVQAPPNATVGALGTLRIEAGGASATVALRVSKSAPLVPQADEPSTLEIASQYVVEHPAALGGLVVAGGALAAVPVLRRERAKVLLVAAGLPLYTRLAKPSLLDEKQRGRIHALIVQRPGIHYSALRTETGLGAGALVHHLRALEKHQLVVSRRDGKLRRHYATGLAPSAAEAAGPTPDQQRILALLDERPMTRPELAARLGLSQQGVSYHVKNLERAGRVVVRGEGGAALVSRVHDLNRV